MPTNAGSAAGSGTLVVNVSDADDTTAIVKTARTVVPGIAGIAGQATSYSIACKNTTTGVTVSPSMTSFGPQTISNLLPGGYTITVNAFKESELIATGSASVTVGEGATVAAYVKIKPAQTGKDGSFKLNIIWPTASAAKISWAINNGAAEPAPEITVGGRGQSSASLIGLPRPAGIYAVRINFLDGNDKITGTQLEVVNVYDNMVSNMFVNADGSLSSERVYSAAEVMNMGDAVSATATVRIIAGIEMEKIDLVSGTTDYSYNAGTSNVITIIPSASMAGQLITYTWTPSSGTAIAATVAASDAPLTFSVPVVRDIDGGVSRTNVLTLDVAAPNPATSQSYSISIRSPIHITNGANLHSALAELDNNVVLDGPIAISSWAPVGAISASPYTDQSSMFNGAFNGNGYTITGLSVSTSNGDAGLFGVVGKKAVITGVRLMDVSVWGGNNDDGVGGLVGENYGGTISRCSVSGLVQGRQCVGGLVGNNRAEAAYNFKGTISESYSTAIVKGQTNYVGGLVGSNWGKILDCYSRSLVSTGSTIAGLVGSQAATGEIVNCYSSGYIYDSSSKYGFIGGSSGSCSSSYFNGELCGLTDALGTSKTSAQLKTQSGYTGWDFSSVWAIDSTSTQKNSGYPYLKNLPPESISITNASMTGTNFSNLIGNNPAADFILDVPTALSLSGSMPPVGLIGVAPYVCVPFMGTFNGNGKTITGLTVTDQQNAGMFAQIGAGATVKNLQLTGVSIPGSSNTKGAIAGRNNGTVYRCSSSGIINGNEGIGGLVGSNLGTVEECWSNMTVTASLYSGGLVGANGEGTGGKTGLIRNCYARGNVNVCWGGGLVGSNNLQGTVVNSYASGKVTPAGSSGSSLGNLQELIGANGGTITKCFFDWYKIQVSYAGGTAKTSGFNGAEKTSTQMRTQATFASDWDFTNVWKIEAGKNAGYPFLISVTPTQDIEINNQTDLANISANASMDYILKGPITLPDNISWTPLAAFDGNFDGNGQTISSLYINGSTDANTGLFSVIAAGGYVRNLTLTGVSITNSSTDGARQYGMLAGRNEGTISGCSASGSISAYNYVGGLVGQNSRLIENCSARGAVTAKNWYAGGLVAYNGCEINACYANARVAGLNCVGGLIGQNLSGGNAVQNSYARGSAIISSDASGSYGGFVGLLQSGTIKNCYAASFITAEGASVGSFAGIATGGTIQDCYYDNTLNDYHANSATGYTRTSIRDLTNFSGWGASGWLQNNGINNGYPYMTTNAPSPDIQLTQTMSTSDINNALNSNKNGNFVLTSPLSISGSWTSVGSLTDPFNGTIDGNGYAITNQVSSGNSGLFGRIGPAGNITNLTINYSSGLTVTTLDSGWWAGGIAAINEGVITHCAVRGTLSGTLTDYGLGGITGKNAGVIAESYSIATITGNSRYTGGIAGENMTGGMVINTFNRGAITGYDTIGGLIGQVDANGSVINCYSTGLITGTVTSGGLIGRYSTSTLTNAFYDELSGQNDTGKGEKKLTGDMKALSVFPSVIWGTGNAALNDGYPYLQFFGAKTITAQITLAGCYNNSTPLAFTNGGTITMSETDHKGNANAAYAVKSGTSLSTTVSTVLFTGAQPFTIAGWFRVDVFSGYSYLFYNVSSNCNYGVVMGGTPGFSAQISKTGDGTTARSSGYSNSSVTGEWTHIAMVYDSSKCVTLYVNGVSQPTSASYTSTTGACSSFYFGAFTGAMSDLRIYNSALDATAINNLKNQ
jgi:hypothetical protein